MLYHCSGERSFPVRIVRDGYHFDLEANAREDLYAQCSRRWLRAIHFHEQATEVALRSCIGTCSGFLPSPRNAQSCPL